MLKRRLIWPSGGRFRVIKPADHRGSMSQRYCPECGGDLLYEPATKHYTCQKCGLFATREQILAIRERLYSELDEKERRKRQLREYMEWWESKK